MVGEEHDQRMHRSRLVVSGLLLAAGLLATGCGSRAAADAATEAGDDELVVACTPNGIEVSARTLVVGRDGVTFRVSSALPDSGGLSIQALDGDYDGTGGFLSNGPTAQRLQVPPGPVRLSCVSTLSKSCQFPAVW